MELMLALMNLVHLGSTGEVVALLLASLYCKFLYSYTKLT